MLTLLELVLLIVITSAKDNIPPRTVNLELDTSFFFDPGDANSPLVMGLRRLLDKIDDTFKQNKNLLRTPKPRESIKFIDFLKQLKEIIVDFDDDSVKRVFKTLNKQVQRYNANGNSELHKIIFEPKLKKYVVEKIKELSDLHPKKLKSKFKNVFKSISNIDPIIVKFVSMLDGFFDQDDSDDLESTIARFKDLPKKGHVQEIVKNTLELIVYDRYKKLNYTSKTKFAEAITKLNELVPERSEVEVHIFRKSGAESKGKYMKDENKNELERDSDDHVEQYAKNDAFSNEFNRTSRKEAKNESVEDKRHENTNIENSTNITKADSKTQLNPNNNSIASSNSSDMKVNSTNETRSLDEATEFNIRDSFRRSGDDEIVVAKDLDDFSGSVEGNAFVDADDSLNNVTEVTRDDGNKDIVVGRDVEIFVRAFSDQ